MTKKEIEKKFDDLGLIKSKEPNLWYIPGDDPFTFRYGISIDNYSFTRKSNLGILICPINGFGSVYSYKLGIKEIQKIIQKGVELIEKDIKSY